MDFLERKTQFPMLVEYHQHQYGSGYENQNKGFAPIFFFFKNKNGNNKEGGQKPRFSRQKFNRKEGFVRINNGDNEP